MDHSIAAADANNIAVTTYHDTDDRKTKPSHTHTKKNVL